MSTSVGAAEQRAEQRTRTLTPAEIAWIVLMPCAVAMVAVIVVAGPPLGQLLFEPEAEGLWPPGWSGSQGRAEPVKQARYLLAVVAPLVLAAAILASVRREPRLGPRTIRALTLASQGILLAFVVIAVLGQRNVILVDRQLPPIFGNGAILAATALTLAGLVALRRREVAERVAWLARETTLRRATGVAVAIAVSALWMLTSISTDSIAEDVGSMEWTLNDAFAVLNGRTPLVDYHVLYAKLLPYPAALAIATFGTTAFVYTTAMAVLSVLALLAVYAIFRRIVGSSLLALALFVPFLATSGVDESTILTAMWPMRYGGAFLLAWMTARHVDRRSPRHAWVLFFVGGVVAINNSEFGVGAVLATIAALLCAQPPRSVRDVLRLSAHVGGGALGAVAAVSLLTFIRAGALPDPALLTEWPRIFTKLGWFSMPMPTASLHLVVYATFVAAIAVAAVRLTRPDDDVLLTSMLAWSGIFGLVAGSYYVGRSDDLKLVSMFAAGSFALSLLTIVSVRALAVRGWRRPTPAQLLVLFGFALSSCSVVDFPLPHTQIARLTEQRPAPFVRPIAKQFVLDDTQPGEKVALLFPMGYRVAYELGLDNISPYGTQAAIVTRWQLQTVIDAVRREHVHKIFLRQELTARPQLEVLAQEGFQPRAQVPGFIEVVER